MRDDNMTQCINNNRHNRLIILLLWVASGPLQVAGCARESAPIAGTPLSADTLTTNSIGMEFVEIPAGEFLMGAPEDDPQALPNQQPQHRVVLTRPFWLGRFEVTQAEYTRVMGKNPCHFGPAGRGYVDVQRKYDTDRFPVEFVNWYEATEFCRKLSELPEERAAGRSYRLPTEAEWEYACRAGTTTRFSFGEAPDSRYANFLGDVGHPLPVGSYPPNPFGLYDMHGNVLEWCSDWHAEDYYAQSPGVDPQGPEFPVDDVRVLRGGGYLFQAATAAFRDRISPHLRGPSHGFRVVLEQNSAHLPE